MGKLTMLFTLCFIFFISYAIKDPYDCIWANCPSQAAACDDKCTNILYSCWGKCSNNSCGTFCIGGTGNAQAVNVWNCALQKGCSPYSTINLIE